MVNQMMQAERQQELVQYAVQEQTEVAGICNKAGQSGDDSLYIRPYIGGAPAQNHGKNRQEQEGETGAGEHLQEAAELLAAVLIEEPAGQAAQDDAAEYAHVQNLDAEHGGLAGTGQAQSSHLSQTAGAA